MVLGDECLACWEAGANVMVSHNEESLLTPTFFHPLLSRKYRISITARIEGLGHAVFHLELPIQVIHRPIYDTGERGPTVTHGLTENTMIPHHTEDPSVDTETVLNLPSYIQ